MKFFSVVELVTAGLLLGTASAQVQSPSVSTLPGPVLPPASGNPTADYALLQALLHATRPPLVFHVDDVLSVRIVGIEDYAIKQRVGDDGTIAFPLIGRTQVAGLSVTELQAKIVAALAAGNMVRTAQVTIGIELSPSEIVTVLGDVRSPGTFPASGKLGLVDFLSQAGGFVENVTSAQGGASAASYIVSLSRTGLSAPVQIPVSPALADAQWGHIPLFPGDEVRVSKVGVVYAVGALRTQGSYQLKNTGPTTVTQIVALAGGMGYEASAGDTHIVRRSIGVITVIPVDVSRILKGTDPDLPLLADDILFVPTNKLKAAIKGGGSAIIVSLASAALYSR